MILENKIPSGFYVYLWKRPNGIPFYVGKGKKLRGILQNYGHNHNKFLQRTIRKLDCNKISVEFFSCDNEKKALTLEIKLIAQYKRRNEGGVLCNLTNGGEGFSGLVFSKLHLHNLSLAHMGQTNGFRSGHKHSLESRKKLSEAAKRQFSNPRARAAVRRFMLSSKMNRILRKRARVQWSNPKSRAKILAGIQSPEARKKYSIIWKDRKHSLSTRKKMSAASARRWRNPEYRKKWLATRAKRIY